jgi:hypothetical protein
MERRWRWGRGGEEKVAMDDNEGEEVEEEEGRRWISVRE